MRTRGGNSSERSRRGRIAGLERTPRTRSRPVDGWPPRPVRVISPTATGGPGQNFRMYADHLKDTFGQNFVLENMPGGSGSVGCMAVARSAPDGHTLLLASNSHIVLAPLVHHRLAGQREARLRPIALMFTFPFLLVVNRRARPEDAEGAGRLRQGAARGSSTGARPASAPADIW